MCVFVYKVDGSVCVCRWRWGGSYDMNICASLCVLLHKCVLSGDVFVCLCVCVCDVHLPLVVFSARVERSGLSALTLSHSTSETHILPDRERQRRSKGRKGQRVALIFVILYLCLCITPYKNTHSHTPFKSFKCLLF